MSSAAASARITGPLEKAVSSTFADAVVLAGVLLELHLHLDAHDAVIVLLQTAELLGHVLAEPVGHLAVPSRDHNLHVNLLN